MAIARTFRRTCDAGGVTYRLISDYRGSVRLVVNAATGTVAQRLDYSAFGEVLLDTNPGFQPLGFAGSLYDPDTRLTRFGPREYDAATGVWLQPDPNDFGGRQLNLYAYVAGDPINRLDVGGTNFVDVGVYDGGWGGHSSVNLDGDGFEGFYPRNREDLTFGKGDVPGEVRGPNTKTPENQHPNHVYRFKITKQQAEKIRKFIERQRGQRRYNLGFNNCADFVLDAISRRGTCCRTHRRCASSAHRGFDASPSMRQPSFLKNSRITRRRVLPRRSSSQFYANQRRHVID